MAALVLWMPECRGEWPTVENLTPTSIRTPFRAGAAVLLAAVAVGFLGVFVWLTLSLPPSVPGSQVSGTPLIVVVPMLALVAVGLVLAIRVPGNSTGWVVSGGALSLALLLAGSLYIARFQFAHDVPAALAWPMAILDVIGWSTGFPLLLIVLPMLFPDGRLASPRWRITVWITAATVLLTAVTSLLALGVTGLTAAQDTSRFTIGEKALFLLDGPVSGILIVVLMVSALVSLALRYRRADPGLRQQLKWFIAAVTIAALTIVPILVGVSSEAGGIAAAIAMCLVPLSIGIAVLRYRLYDLDIILSRALAYAALAALIAALYVVAVVGVGPLFVTSGKWSLSISIAATVVVAVVFQPVRERLERAANRLVYGRRATPYEVLSEFSRRIAESFADDELLERMARVLGEGTGAQLAEVWLRRGSILQRAVAWPAGADVAVPVPVSGRILPPMEGDRAVAVRHQGELLGALTVTKRRGNRLTPIEEKLLADLAGQAGLVLRNVGLNDELMGKVDQLRASRQRLVEAQDGERRRIERDIHDGAQQHLVAIKIKLGLVEDLAMKDPTSVLAAVEELKTDADAALQTLRDLARGIYPPLLADQGLDAALKAQARNATVPVSIEIDGVGRLAPEVEGAVYFCCLEALQNVQKHAHATTATVRLWKEAGQLNFEVSDDGDGFDVGHTRRGAGFTNMKDRLEALGGSMKVTSEPERGARLTGTLSLEPATAAEPATSDLSTHPGKEETAHA